MKYNRHSIRLKKFDYSSNEWYFVTICSQGREEIFGEIINQRMILNRSGLIITNWLMKLEKRYCLHLDEFVVMPNHIHVIFGIVGAHHDAPKITKTIGVVKNERAIRESPLQKRSELSKIIGFLKMNVSKEIGMKIWQRNFYEHIIRNEMKLEKIREYIRLNPVMWNRDRNNPIIFKASRRQDQN